MGKYKCLQCKNTFECEENTSGIGVCPKCTPIYLEELKKLPKKGNIKDLPNKFNPLGGKNE